MSAFIQRLFRDENGFTVVELGFAMLLTGLISALMLTWILSVAGADERQRSNDAALGDLRDVTDQVGRDVRSAEYLTVAQTHDLSMWLDANGDGTLDPGELVSWSIQGDATVTRSTSDGRTVVVAEQIDQAASSFSYDAADPAEVAMVSFEIIATSESGGGTDLLRISSDVYLRNS